MFAYEEAAYQKGYRLLCGIDEAGRGPLAGPVVAAACMLPRNYFVEGVNDSKQLTPKTRARLFERLTTDPRIIYAVASVTSEEIDQINIYQATMVAMLKAVEKLSVQPDYLLVDGLLLPHPTLFVEKIIKGDALSHSIAAASIIAKVTRDQMMCDWDKQWPQYGFAQHKGYGTPQHVEMIRQHGPCPIHRRSFEPIKSTFEISCV